MKRKFKPYDGIPFRSALHPMFGFTGTPILTKNAIDKRTTKDLFEERLHDYVITDAIRDENVLRFSVEYVGPGPGGLPPGVTPADLVDHPDRIGAVTDWIIANHARKTRGREFSSIFAVSSVDALCRYYDAFRERELAGGHDLKIATIFTYAANEADPDADGLIPDPEFPTDGTRADLPSRDRLVEFVEHYNARFGVNETVRDGRGFYTYYQSLAKRMKARDKRGFDPADGIDILLVVNMFLTGFDAKTLNTLYADKNLRYHGLIQAFSRTNRTLGETKSQGNIVCFRDLKDNTDDAIALFANRDANEVVLIGSYEEHLVRFEEALLALREVAETPDDVDTLPDEEAQKAFIKAFRDLMRLRNVLGTFSEFDQDHLPMDPQEYEDFKSKYLDLSQRTKGEGGDGESLLDGIDFELELLRRDEINLTYIRALLLSLQQTEQDEGHDSSRAREKRQQILDLLASEIGLRSKRPHLEAFLNDVMPALNPDDDIEAAFEVFWTQRREAAVAAICEAEGLDRDGVDTLVGEMLFTGKRPLRDDVLGLLKEKPRILRQKKVVEKVIKAIEDLVETFDDGFGEADQ
jgi:type I restriction enzyme R subunit